MKKLKSTKIVLTDKSTQLENNIYYLQRRLKEWRLAFWFMFTVALGLAVAWVTR